MSKTEVGTLALLHEVGRTSLVMPFLGMRDRLSKLELGVVDTKGDADLLEQRIEEAMGDLRGQIEDLQEGMQGSSVHVVSHEDFIAFQDKVLSVLTRLESMVDALTRNVEARDEQMRQELAICKVAVSAQVMATHEDSKDYHTTGGGEVVSPCIAKYGKDMMSYNRDKGKGKQPEFAPRLRCFICDGLHLARECPKREALNALIKKSEKEEENACLGSMQMLGAL